MQIISIDVGMKNLAFCLVEIKNNDYIIKDWDIIDLCETQNHICKFPKKNNIQCSKKAKYVKDGIYYCKIHGKKSEYKIPTKELKASKLKKSRLSELKIIVDKYDISCCKMLAFSIAQRLLCSNSNNMHFVRCHKVSHIPS